MRKSAWGGCVWGPPLPYPANDKHFRFALAHVSTNEAGPSAGAALGAGGARGGGNRLPLYDVVTKGTERDKVKAKKALTGKRKTLAP